MSIEVGDCVVNDRKNEPIQRCVANYVIYDEKGIPATDFIKRSDARPKRVPTLGMHTATHTKRWHLSNARETDNNKDSDRTARRRTDHARYWLSIKCMWSARFKDVEQREIRCWTQFWPTGIFTQRHTNPKRSYFCSDAMKANYW
jgi:hypothetical protein